MIIHVKLDREQFFIARKYNIGNVWKVARKRKSWTSLNFYVYIQILYIASIFTRVKFPWVRT